jgi:hypothetical protein
VLILTDEVVCIDKCERVVVVSLGEIILEFLQEFAVSTTVTLVEKHCCLIKL